jgi:TatD DNase family protein
LTGDRLSESRRVVDLASKYEGLYSTVGCHPCRSEEALKHKGGLDDYMQGLSRIIRENLGGRQGKGKVVAVGECGLGNKEIWHTLWGIALTVRGQEQTTTGSS